MDEVGNELIRLAKASLKAMEMTGRTVASVNPDMLLDAAEQMDRCGKAVTFGVKNTGQIERRLLRRLVESGGYVWHTVDHMAEGGRAIDPALSNPLTLRPMTGSSSGTALNVLYGINDLGIGTDGGGSVLAPALSLNLCSIMAKGLGLAGADERVSTDRIPFTPGIGVISHDFSLARQAVLTMAGLQGIPSDGSALRFAVCHPGHLSLPDGTDMFERLDPVIQTLKSFGCKVESAAFPDFADRQESIKTAGELFQRFDCLLTFEGPVDVEGVGDSVLGGMGSFARSGQMKSGKYMVKIANMIGATAIALPGDEAASGLVLTARVGRDTGLAVLAVAEHLSRLYPQPDLYRSYFRGGLTRRSNALLFSLKE